MKNMNIAEMKLANAGGYKYLYECKHCGGLWGTNSWFLKDYRKYQRDAHQRNCQNLIDYIMK